MLRDKMLTLIKESEVLCAKEGSAVRYKLITEPFCKTCGKIVILKKNEVAEHTAIKQQAIGYKTILAVNWIITYNDN
jgi:hypothetical protein